MTENCATVLEANDSPIKREEAQVRCPNPDCGKFLTKLILTKSVPEGYDPEKTISQQGIEVKIGIETKCPRCKEIDSRVIVI